ncbi:hypothetical protein [Ectobacillus ponti]|uniref:HNH endonuclease n=1 Tax=Ectobacillus ponti TaxID=2961894 RepID=A0AA41XAA6_9BACI|nr:hypothetical protein [Ectobacillus ponti]MCP8969225.1 hypothetical protein [Ectobacillus ponti]
MIQPTGYWTFFCNTKQWDIEVDLSRVSGNPYDIFSVTRWQKDWFRKGQLGLVRVGMDQRTKDQLKGRQRLKRGIYTIAEILGEAYPASEDRGAYWTGRYIVDIRYVRNLLQTPISLRYFHEDTPEYDKYLVHGFQASSMPLKPEAFAAAVAGAGGADLLDLEVNRSMVQVQEEILDVERIYQDAVPEVQERISRYIETGRAAEEYKQLQGYTCQICGAMGIELPSFQTKYGRPYIEVHHIMPKGLVTHNLLTVCPLHHRQLHYGNAEVLENSKERILLQIDAQAVEIRKGAVRF